MGMTLILCSVWSKKSSPSCKCNLGTSTHWKALPTTATLSPQKFWHFGFMRDPVSRFVSATAQEMTVLTSRSKARKFRTMCPKDNAEDTLKCAIKAVREWFASQCMIHMHYVHSAVIFTNEPLGERRDESSII